MPDYICMNCWHGIDTKVEKPKRIYCSKCGRSAVFPLDDMIEAVTELKAALENPELQQIMVNAGSTEAEKMFKKFERECKTVYRLLEPLEYPTCIIRLAQIINLAQEYDPAKLSAEDTVYLFLRKMDRRTA